MGASTADISRRTFDEVKRYVQTVLQQGVPVVDADQNEQVESFYTQLRRAIANSIGDGARGAAFQVAAIPAANDFTVKGGDLGDEGAESLFVKGHRAHLLADETFLAGVETAPVSVGFQTGTFANDTLVDTAANYAPGSLVGKTLTPNLEDLPTFVIVANTATTIRVGATMAATPGKRYRVHLTTPGADRADLVYLDVYLDEIDSAEDVNLKHTIGSLQVTSALRLKARQTVFVTEGVTLPVSLASGFTDADGNRHVLLPIALLNREAGNALVTAGMIVDLRPRIFTLEEAEGRFVNAAGDTMTGPLVMAADIEMGPGQRVTGVCVIDGDAICPEVVEQRHFKRDSHLLGDGGEVPTFSEVNDPLDPNHFKVHDNRYYCVSEDTEILTADGWKKHDALKEGDVIWSFDMGSERLIKNPIKKIVRYTDFKEMWHFRSRRGDFLMTQEHAVVYRWNRGSEHGKRWAKAPVQEIPGKGELHIPVAGVAPELQPDERRAAYWELYGWFVAEGTGEPRDQRISQNRVPNLERIKILLDLLDAKHSEYLNTAKGSPYRIPLRQGDGSTVIAEGVTTEDCMDVRLSTKDARRLGLRKDLRGLMDCEDLDFEALLRGLVGGDGHWENAEYAKFYQARESVIDDLQALCAKHGYQTIKKPHLPGMWRLCISKTHVTTSLTRHWSVEPYKGVSWCVSVDAGTIVARRNGYVAVFGNTKNQVDNLIGTNTIANGLFDAGFEGWENAIPRPLFGGPSDEAARCAIVSLGLCGSPCGTDCACRVLQVCLLPGCRVCFVCPLRQEVALRCGGRFQLIQTICVTKGDEAVRPFFLLDLYSSCQFVGQMKVDMFTPPPDDPTKAGVEAGDGFARLEKTVNIPTCVDQVFVTPCYEVVFQAPLGPPEAFPSSPFPPSPSPVSPVSPVSPSPSSGGLAAKCEVGPNGLEWSVCALQMRRITGVEGEFSRRGGNTTAEPVITECSVEGGIRQVCFTPGIGQVSTILERLEEEVGGVPSGLFPTNFPGIVLDPASDACVKEVDVFAQPTRTCQCMLNCTDPGGVLAVPLCYLYGDEAGNIEFGAPEITDTALGVSVSAELGFFLVRFALAGSPIDFLQAAGADENNTALKFSLGRVTTGPAPDQEMRVLVVDDEGRRALYGFESVADAAVKGVMIPLADFQRLDSAAFDWTQVTEVWIGYAMGLVPLLCQFSVDNLRVCSKTDASVYTFAIAATIFPHNQVAGDETCVTLEDFEGPDAFDRVGCGLPFPLGTVPPDIDIDFCEQSTPIPVDGEGTGGLRFEVGPRILPAPVGVIRLFSPALDLTADASPKFRVAVNLNRSASSVWLVARSSNGGASIEKFTGLAAGNHVLGSDFGTAVAGIPAFDITAITRIGVYFSPVENPQIGDVYRTDNWRRNAGATLVEGWNDADQAAFDARDDVECGYGVGLVLDNVFATGMKFDPATTPLIAVSADRTKVIAYWGQSEETVRDADLVLVPAKFRDDALVGEAGSGGVDPDTGLPLPGAEAALARDTGAKWGRLAFALPPPAGCRNIWCDLVYLDRVECEGASPSLETFEFFDPMCACVLPATTKDVSGPVTDDCFSRLLPDDEFDTLPEGYPEAISFEYCALPRLDRSEITGNEFFDFVRETPECARPDGAYLVRVTIRSKTGPLSVDWTDTLPAGHTLLSGALSGTAVFVCAGESRTFEYVVQTPGPGNPDFQITGTAQVTGSPPTLVTLVSDLVEMSENCATLCFLQFGSQNPHVYGKVFWAGGGRADPTPAAEDGLYVTVYAGPGSPGLSEREDFLILDQTVAPADTSGTFRILPALIGGFAVGRPVWVFNKCFSDNPLRRIHLVDIEREEAQANPDQEVTGIYGTITAINAVTGDITVAFEAPEETVQFRVTAQAAIMIAPAGSKGFYWEANKALAELLQNFAGLSQSIIRFSYRFWNSTKYACPDKIGAAFVCDGDGETTGFSLIGDTTKDILNPRDWIDLPFNSPVGPSVPLKVDANPGDTTISVCDICIFAPCDVIQVVDDDCSGQDGNGPGYVGAVVSTTPTGVPTCLTAPAAEGDVEIAPPIPDDIEGCPGFSGFTVAADARAFVKPDVCRYAISPTLKCLDGGLPAGGAGFACVDFATGLIRFDPTVRAVNPYVCFRKLEDCVLLPPERGIYYLVGVDEGGRRSPPSKPILVGAAQIAAPPKGYVGEIKIVSFDIDDPPTEITELIFEHVVVADENARKVLCPTPGTVVDGASVGVNGIDAAPVLGDPGSEDNWYHIFAIGDSEGLLPDAGLISLSPTAPALPVGYNLLRRIGAARSDALGGLFGFRQIGREVYYERFHVIFSGVPFGGSPALPAAIVDASSRVPPLVQRVILYVDVNFSSPAGEELRFFDGGQAATPVVVSDKVAYATSPATALVYSNSDFRIHVSPTQTFLMTSSGAAVLGANVAVRGFLLDLF